MVKEAAVKDRERQYEVKISDLDFVINNNSQQSRKEGSDLK